MQPDARGGLVHEVDGLVGQETVADIPVGQGGGGLKRLVGDFYLVMRLVAVAAGPLRMASASSGVGSPTSTGWVGWKRPAPGGVLSMRSCGIRQGGCADDRESPCPGRRAGLRMLAASIAFGLAGAHQRVWNSSIKRITFPCFFHILMVSLAALKFAPVICSGDHVVQVQGKTDACG